MTRAQAAAWATVAAIAGGAALAYLLSTVPPRLPTNDLNLGAVIAFYSALLLLVTGLASIAALPLHDRWPALAGVDRRHPGVRPAPEVALRQGFLVALAVIVLVLLRMFQVLDPAFILVALLLAGLVEAFWQARPLRRP